MNTVIIKIGTESLANFETSEKVNKLVRDIVEIMKHTQYRVLLVSSGAVGFGRKIRPDIEDKHVLAGIGWNKLLEAYAKKFTELEVTVSGILATHADIEDYESSQNRLIETVNAHWSYWVLPIINENDALSSEEMNEVKRGADNDQNALLLAKVFKAESLIIVSNTNGVYADRNDPSSRIVSINCDELSDEFIENICGDARSASGTGGMSSKLHVARKSGKNGIRTAIIDGTTSGVLDHLQGTAQGGTEIFPSEK